MIKPKPDDIDVNIHAKDENKENENEKGEGANMKMLFAVMGIYTCYLIYGVVQERLNKTEYGPNNVRFNYTFFTLLVQCICNALIALIVLKSSSLPVADATPARNYALMALTYVLAMYFSNAALAYVDYPTQALAKACKPIPVLLIGIIVLKKQQPLLKYVCVLLISAGVASFMLWSPHAAAKSKAKAVEVEQDTYIYGVLLLFASLAMDGFTSPFQERVCRESKPTSRHLMFWTNVWAIPIISIGTLAYGQLTPALEFIEQYPNILIDLGLFSLMSAFGQVFIFYTVSEFGIITTTRKFFTILISVIGFGHALAPKQWFSVAMVFIGLSVDLIWGKAKKGSKIGAEKKTE